MAVAARALTKFTGDIFLPLLHNFPSLSTAHSPCVSLITPFFFYILLLYISTTQIFLNL